MTEKFNNSLEADALNWDTREIKKEPTNVISDKDFIDIWHDLQFKKRHKKVKKCACFDSDSYTCYFLRYPNQIELDGRDYCQCSCHTEKEMV